MGAEQDYDDVVTALGCAVDGTAETDSCSGKVDAGVVCCSLVLSPWSL